MLYSEIKERENRFITALKIVFPFLLLLIISFQFVYHDLTNLFLLIILIPIYVYYIVYLIYHGFQTTLIDPLTKTFNRSKIISKIEKIKHRDKTVIIFLHVRNLADINERYGFNRGDLILRQFIKKLQFFLKEHRFKKIPIGRYGNSTFVFFLEAPTSELKHLMMMFTKSIHNMGIDNIELKVDFSMIGADYDTSIDNIMEKLIELSEKTQKIEEKYNFKPDTLKSIVIEALKHKRLSFRYQPSLTLKTDQKEIFEVLARIESNEYGTLTKQHIQRIVNHTGYEKEFDEAVFEALLNELDPLLKKTNVLFSIEISPVTLRNYTFKRYLEKLFASKKIDPSRFILEMTEKKSYEEMHRFNELIKSYHALGFKIALGHFGGNNSSMEYLKYLPIDFVKFDIEFTKNIELPKYQTLLKYYIELCRALHIQTMVKFVDKEALFEKIKSFEPDFIQGFCVTKPKMIEQL